MEQTRAAGPRTFARDAAVATLVLVCLYGLVRGVQFQPLRIPGYLLVGGFDVLEGAVGPADTYYYPLFVVYLLGLGAAGGVVATVLRRRSPQTGIAGWRLGAAGALAVLGSISLVFATAMLVGTAQLAPVLVTGAAGVVMLLLAGWLAGHLAPSAPR